MKKRNVYIIILILILLILGGSLLLNKSKNKSSNENINKIESNEVIYRNDIVEVISKMVGFKANQIEVIDEPLGIKGEVEAKNESITNFVNYYLQKTENEKMSNLKISTEKEYLNIYVEYKVINSIKTPIDVKIIPSIDDNNNVIINIHEIKLLDLKVPDFIKNLVLKNFIEDWLPKEEEIKIDFNNGNIIIYKENLKGLEINELLLENNGIKLKFFINIKEK